MKRLFGILFFVFALAVLLSPAPVNAFWQRAGFHLGSCSYEDDIGSIYDENAFLVGLHYQILFFPLFGLNFQYDFFTVSTGDVAIYDQHHSYLDRVGTDIQGGILSITPTIHVRFHPEQMFVPQFGLGLSLFHGRQTFDDSQYFSEADNDFSGAGFNFSAGFDLIFSPQVGLHFESRYHWLRVAIDEGPNDAKTEYNGIAEFYAGFIFRFSRNR